MMVRRSAFTFIEVLFAVMILGIGMIMVAAMFPAALKQTQANIEDAASGSIAQVGDNSMQLLAQDKDTPLATPPVDTLDRLLYSESTSGDGSKPGYPIVYSFHDHRLAPLPSPTTAAELWQLVSPNLVSANDPQYAWVPLFSRGTNIGTTKNAGPHGTLERSFRLFVIPVRCRNRSAGYVGTLPPVGPLNTVSGGANYSNSDIYVDTNNGQSNIEPSAIQLNVIVPSATLVAQGYQPYLQVVGVYYGVGWSQVAKYSDAGGSGTNVLDSHPQFNPVATGAYVVISDAGNTLPTCAYNGAIFKVGSQVQSDGTGVGTSGEYWSIAPDPNGYSLSALTAAIGAGNPPLNVNFALVVGRGPDYSSPLFSATGPQANPIPRTGAAQDLGIFLTVVALP